jgi:YHS domain-containing protein
MIRLIYYTILAYVIYLIYKFFQNLGRRREPQQPKPRLSGTMVKDEACGVYIPREEAIREVINGREYFFCSRECRKKFLEQTKNAR